MKDITTYNLYFGMKVKHYLSVFLLVMFIPVFHLTAQNNQAIQLLNSLHEDTLLISQYLEANKRGSVAPDSTLKLLHAASFLAKKHHLQSHVVYIWGVMAGEKLQQGNFKDSKLYLDSAFRLNDSLKDGTMTCYLNTVAGGMYQFSANYAKAASHYFRALEAVQEYKIDKSSTLLSLYNNLGGLMSLLNQDSLSRKYLSLAKYHALRIQPIDSENLTFILVNLGQSNLRYDSSAAIGYFKEAYQLAKKIHNNHFSSRILINLSRSYMEQKQYDSSEYYLKLAKEVSVSERSLIEIETVAGFLSFYRKDYATAIRHMETALDMGKANDYDYMEEIYGGLAEIYAARNEYSKAYEFQKKYIAQYDKRMEDPQKVVVDFMLNFQSLEHDKRIMEKQTEIAVKESAIRKQHSWIVAMCVLSALLFVILVMAYLNYRNRKILLNERMQTILQHQEIDKLKAEAEGADKERTRIAYDLHDAVMARLANVKMNLNGLPAVFPEFTASNRYKDIMASLDTASRELRNTAHNLMPEILLEDGIAQAIFYFCKATEQASGLTVKFQQVGAPIPRLQMQVETTVYRIVQGLIQNVIQHAKATTTLVQLQYAHNLCAITVEDNGQGISNLKDAEGYGLKSIRNRIKVLNGTFDIESDEGRGSTAYLEFDVQPFL